MCSSAVTSDWSIICSSELSVICSSKNVVRSLYSPSLYILRHFISPGSLPSGGQRRRPCCIVSERREGECPSGRHANRRRSLPKNEFRLMSLFRTRRVAQSATARFGTHHSRRLSCALGGGLPRNPIFGLVQSNARWVMGCAYIDQTLYVKEVSCCC